MESNTFDVVEDIEEVGLDGVGVRGLAQDLKQRRVRDEEETRKYQSLLFQIAVGYDQKRDITCKTLGFKNCSISQHLIVLKYSN